jgi:invasion protein IalB
LVTRRSLLSYGVRQQASKCALAAAALLVLATTASAQTGGKTEPGGAVPKPPAQGAAKDAKAAAEKPAAKIAGTFGQWALVCGEANGKTEAPLCSLVQTLIEKESKQLVFRVALAYGPKGNLVLRIDGPTGVALQRGSNFLLMR